MSKTVADLMNEPRGYSTQGTQVPEALLRNFAEKAEIPREPHLMVVSLVMDPADVQIIDGKLVYRKEVLARNRQEAVERLGIEVR